MSQLITGEKTPQQMKDMRECGKMLATIYDELKKSVTAGMSELEVPGSNLYIDERSIGAFFPDRICF